ncbi:MAG: hypothetical protein WA989_07690 [Henriciella sp.]
MAIPFAQAALAEPPQDVEAGSEVDRLPAQLDDFVQSAIDQGLLQPSLPAGTGPEKTSRPAAPPPAPETAPTVAPETVSLRPRQGQLAQQGCALSSPYDFADFVDLHTYQDLMSWRGVLEAEETATSQVLLAKGYLVLGLNEESRMQLMGKTDRTATALRELAWLMEGRGYPNISYFADLADCEDSARIWLALARLRAGDPSGARILSARFEDYSQLPLHMRMAYARLAVPMLDRMKEVELARQVLVTFSDDQINTHERLRFAATLVGFSVGTPEAEGWLRHYLKLAEYRDEAAAALRRGGLSVDDNIESEYITRLVDDYGKLPEDIPVEDSLDVLMSDLQTAADYAMTRQLASLPAAQSEEARARLSDHYVALVKADLRSADTLTNLKGMDALLNGGALLEGRDDLEDTFGEAAALAAHLGLKTLSEKLSEQVSSGEALAVAQAQLAFRLGDSETLSSLQARHRGNSDIVTLAALDAVRTGDKPAFAGLESKLSLTPDLALALIAADGAGGHWILPQRYFEAALDVQEPEKKAQLRRILAARPGAADASQSPASLTIADVPRGLDRIGQSLQPDATEMR